MTIRTVAVAAGILVAGAATAAEIDSITGTSLKLNQATGVMECRGNCVVRFKSTDQLSIDGGRMQVDQAAGAPRLFDDAHFIVGNQEFVAEKASLTQAADGTAVFRTESLRVTTLPKRPKPPAEFDLVPVPPRQDLLL